MSKPDDREPAAGERSGQRQADVAQPDDPDADGLPLDLGVDCFHIRAFRTTLGTR